MYFLDLDRDYQFTNLEATAQQELAVLFEPQDCFKNWIEFVSQYPNVMPTIQTRGQSQDEIQQQIQRVQALNRPYLLRIVRDRFPENFVDIMDAFASSGTADFAILIEGGWTRDPLQLAVWFTGVISEISTKIDAQIPIIISCTSIPKMFSSFSSDTPTRIEFSNRVLLDQVSRNSNRARIIYGDWASTRPREPGGFASRPLDRIDYPGEQSWYIARNKEDEWSFEDAAEAILRSPYWDGNLGIWGEEMIQNTTISQELGINTPQKNVAARVNIHLHRQAFYGTSPPPGAFEEDWED
ncbi:hypothetical protein HY30_05275 [Hyphomonas chukchiensis]|uniref:Uncharacterized protein n=2 Tax=Hyphomonas chukchiensis TaxID=1280947 RepID=A0A062UIP4_9PROT|nr:hypothetical protein HY30_05275 [Hyphomonas chukchiensis]